MFASVCEGLVTVLSTMESCTVDFAEFKYKDSLTDQVSSCALFFLANVPGKGETIFFTMPASHLLSFLFLNIVQNYPCYVDQKIMPSFRTAAYFRD